MTTVNIYLNFNGNCEGAFNFYKSVFGGEFRSIRRFKDVTDQEHTGSLRKDMEDKIMHISLPISNETIIMGSDTDGKWFGSGFRQGNNFSISINTDREEEADRLFDNLSKGGKVSMPLDNSFCGVSTLGCSMINLELPGW